MAGSLCRPSRGRKHFLELAMAATKTADFLAIDISLDIGPNLSVFS
jgi:hypothetical protein